MKRAVSAPARSQRQNLRPRPSGVRHATKSCPSQSTPSRRFRVSPRWPGLPPHLVGKHANTRSSSRSGAWKPTCDSQPMKRQSEMKLVTGHRTPNDACLRLADGTPAFTPWSPRLVNAELGQASASWTSSGRSESRPSQPRPPAAFRREPPLRPLREQQTVPSKPPCPSGRNVLPARVLTRAAAGAAIDLALAGSRQRLPATASVLAARSWKSRVREARFPSTAPARERPRGEAPTDGRFIPKGQLHETAMDDSMARR
jgi:hypothetical protein